MKVLGRVILFIFITGINCIYAKQGHVHIDKYTSCLESNELQHTVELIMTHLDIDTYYQYVDFDNIALKITPLTTSSKVYFIPFQTSSSSDWSVCIATMNENDEILSAGLAMNVLPYEDRLTMYPVIEFEKPFIYGKQVKYSIAIDILKTGEVDHKEIVTHEKLVFIPNKVETQLNKVLQYEYNTVFKRDDSKEDNFTFSVNTSDKLEFTDITTNDFYNINLYRELNTSISLVPQLKEKCSSTSKKISPFLIKHQVETPFITSYYFQKTTDEYIYYEDIGMYKKLTSVAPLMNVIKVYEQCVLR
ncbi:hypothetical protein LNQ81_02285 [Myroides sp. M-43]|uniref:hypothetical protein n=1 Tax=Myroides oncorhynchi TaxID=2893756 RepID=UPI001E529EEC|nr:hypothetical protein [Myroides oncorhynchi]MCC9041545.1 hypothetical protein [Myroides oncorhynchi]